MARDPRSVADKWARRLSGATEDIRAGVEAVSENPAEKAIQKKQKLVQRWREAVEREGGKWETSLRKVTLDEWKSAFLQKGLARIPQGTEQARTKVEEFMGQLLPYIDRVKSEIERMPDTTLEQRLNRALEFMRRMAQFRKS